MDEQTDVERNAEEDRPNGEGGGGERNKESSTQNLVLSKKKRERLV